MHRRRDDQLHPLELNPWRDGCDVCIEIVEEKASSRNASLVRHYAADETQDVSRESLDSLLDTMGNELYDLHIFYMQLPPSSSPSTHQHQPSLSAITTLLASCYHVHTMKLIGLDWTDCDELDMNAWYEAIRIHPVLSSLDIRHCQFAKRSHLEGLKNVTMQRKRKDMWSWKHLDISENTIPTTTTTTPISIVKSNARQSALVLLVGLLLLLALFYYAYLA